MENEFFVKDYVKASVLKENLKKMEVLLGEQGRSIVRSVLGVKGTCIVYGADVCTHRSLVMSYLAEYFKAYDICCYHTVFGNFVADYAVVESHVFRDLCRNTDVFLIDDVGRYELSLYRESTFDTTLLRILLSEKSENFKVILGVLDKKLLSKVLREKFAIKRYPIYKCREIVVSNFQELNRKYWECV